MYALEVLARSRERSELRFPSLAKASAFLALSGSMLLAILFSASKMGFAAAIGSLFVSGTLCLIKSVPGSKRWGIIAGFAILTVLLFVLLPSDSLSMAYTAAASDPTAEGRLPIMKDALHLIAAYPLFGVGFGAFNPAFMRYQTSMFQVGWDFAHDDYVQFLAELGIVGFTIAVLLACAAFASATRAALSAEKSRRFLGAACAGSLAAILIHSLAHIGMYVPSNALVYSWIAGLSVGLARPIDREGAKSSPLTLSIWKGAVLTLACFSALYASAHLIFDRSFRNNQRAERVFCRFGICNSDEILSALVAQHGDDPSLVPISQLQEFQRRDPAGPNHWCDLGVFMKRVGREADARECFSRALNLAPRMPLILYRAAVFHFSMGENEKALDLMSRALASDPGYDPTVFGEYADRKVSVKEILQYGLPPIPSSWQSFLRFEMQGKKIADAATVWSWMTPRPGYIDRKLAEEYMNFLLTNKQFEAADRAWASYASVPQYPDPEHIFNGDFEADPAPGSTFDWRINDDPGVAVSIADDIAHSGKRSLKLQFDRTQNMTYFPVWESFYLKPGRYRFRAWVKSQDLSTDQGISFALFDGAGFVTEPVLGSTDWKLVEKTFQVNEAKGLARITLSRVASRKFDDKVAGTLWIDDVSIQPINK
jgi:tetratricopeptide (TPR) repeat protein